jgi:D-alanyl-D-alanine carboxypeptidase
VKGCKTGITQSAGPCFSGYFERNLILENESETIEHVIIIVLNSKTMECRWVEIPEMLNWFLEVKELAIENAENP